MLIGKLNPMTPASPSSTSVVGKLNFPGFQEVLDFTCPVADTNTKALLHFDGSNGATSTTEVTGRTVNMSFGAQLSTAQSKFGTSSLLLDGANDLIYLPDSADWAFGTSAFTIDMWVRFNSYSAATLVGQASSGSNFWSWAVESNTLVLRQYNSTYAIYFTAPFTPNLNQWYHIALVRIDNGNAATSWRVFVDGVSQTLTLVGGAWNGSISDYTNNLEIGGSTAVGTYLNGYIDELRISSSAIWTSNFTPPTSAHTIEGTYSSVSVAVDGDTDKEYKIVVRNLTGVTCYMRLNSDAGASAYGYQVLQNDNGTITAARATTSVMAFFNTLSLNIYTLLTPTGFIKTGFVERNLYTSGTTMRLETIQGHSYNSTSNITSLDFFPDSGNFDAGTRITVFARRSQS